MSNSSIGQSMFREIISQIDDIQEEKRLLRHKEDTLKKRIPTLLEEAIHTMSEEEAKEECEEIYWLCNEFKGRAEIRAAFKKVFGRSLQTESFWTTTCNGCKGTTEVKVTSWKEFQRKKSGKCYCEGECADNADDGMYDE